jgi:hypothetical protein
MKLGTCGRREDNRVGSRFQPARLKAGDCLGDVALYVDNSIKVELQEIRKEGVG